MPQTIGNPISWTVARLRETSHYLGEVAEHIAGSAEATTVPVPEIRRLEVGDLGYALRRGFEDFTTMRSDAVFLVLVYPLIGVGLVALALQRDLLPLLFPIVAGFALIGPLAAVGLYEISRQLERTGQANWIDALGVFRRPAFGAIFLLGLLLLAIFGIWLVAALGIYSLTLGPETPDSLGAFVRDVFTTAAGWAMIVIGMIVGFLFAALVLAISVVSFPLLVDRDNTMTTAVLTSIRVTALNPRPIAIWGLIVALSLALGALPVFLGLIVVLPVLGHATWHLYRRAVVSPQPGVPERLVEAPSYPG